MNIKIPMSVMGGLLIACSAFAYLSPEKELPDQLEIVRVVTEKEEVPCAGEPGARNERLERDSLRLAAAAPCRKVVYMPGNYPICADHSGRRSVAPKRTKRKNSAVPVSPARAPESDVITKFYGYDRDGKIRVIGVPESRCGKAEVLYAKSGKVLVRSGTATKTGAILAMLDKFRVGCRITFALAPAGTNVNFTGEDLRCNEARSAAPEQPEEHEEESVAPAN